MTFLDRLKGKVVTTLSAAIEGTPITSKQTTYFAPKDKKLLETAFRECQVIAQGIIKFTQIIMSGEPTLECKDENVLSYFNDFVDNIGNIGNDLHWYELLMRIFQDQFIYGEAWVEKIFNTNKTRIVDLDIIDATSMDYAKNGSDKIVLDKYGVPVGYVQQLEPGQLEVGRGSFTPPEGVYVANKKYIPREYIAHIMLYRTGNGFYPLGLVEMAYNDILWFLKLKQAYGDKALKVLFPTRVGILGDKQHEPTAEMLQDFVNKLVATEYKTEIALPYFADLKVVEAKHPEALLNFLNFFQEQIIIATGLPKPIVTGLGEETNRATLNVQTKLALMTTKDIIRRTCKAIEHQIFKPISRLEGFYRDKKKKKGLIVPKISWDFAKIEKAIEDVIGNANYISGDGEQYSREEAK